MNTPPSSVLPTHQLSTQIGALLKARSWTITAAESCTGGLLMARLTDVSGSSAYITGGIVTYANATKMQFLGVDEAILRDYGAVSEQCAAAMAHGARTLFSANIALSVTGIAGPTGGTPAKPVGLVYIGMSVAADSNSADHDSTVQRFVWDSDRIANRELSVNAALQMALDWLNQH